MRAVAKRFWKKVLKTETCWLWLGSEGYGRFYVGKKRIAAHRVAYILEYGPVPDQMVIDHLCKVRDCVRPDHLEAVSATENNKRRWGK